MSVPPNVMQFLRRWATANQNASEEVMVSDDAAKLLSGGILTALGVLDSAWEAAAKRSLTEEEKFGPPEEAQRCCECGQPVPNFFDHVALDCIDRVDT